MYQIVGSLNGKYDIVFRGHKINICSRYTNNKDPLNVKEK